MNARKNLKAGAVVLLFLAGAAVAAEPQAVLDVLSAEAGLGPGWKRQITLLFDPLSQPSEILQTATPLPESFKEEQRAMLQNPDNRVSGSSHTRFTLQTTTGSWNYDVQVDRYRNSEQLKQEFDRLLKLDSDQYQKAPVEDLGDAAVFFHNAKGAGATLWFRKGEFKVWIAPLNQITNWAQDRNLQFLAKVLAERIVGDSHAKAMTPNANMEHHASLNDVVPQPEALGIGWNREIEVLMDPASNPSELIHPTEQISEPTLNEWRRAVLDTNHTTSGWAHARFDFHSKAGTNRYHLRVERYRSVSVLQESFARLLAPAPAGQQSIPRGIGDAAVVKYEAGGLTLWFRRGPFRVVVSSFADKQDGSLRHLAQTVDQRILNAVKARK